MPKAARLGDLGSAHGCFPPTPAITGSSDVTINSKPAVRKGDAYALHGCGNCAPHLRNANAGSTTVNVNGKPAVRVGDAIDCGGSAQTGSANVNIGNATWSGKSSDPIKPKMQLFLTQTPGSNFHPYTNEPYKLYKDGALVQEGISDDAGLIEYEFEVPWTSELKVETLLGDFIYKPTALAPPEDEEGTRQRLNLLGFYEHSEWGAATHQGGKLEIEHFQSIFADKITATTDQSLFSKLRSLMP